jgi:NAD(P)-dependent dehydrogenase (short-subunit alcohol dehydrogenase family)
MSKMLAAVLHDFNRLQLEDIPVPEPRGPNSVVVRIKSCGICQTDYKAVKGMRRNVTFSLIPDHEPSGVVAAVGPGVSHSKEGDEVIVCPGGYCGVCPQCRTGNTHYCKQAFSTGGDGIDDVWPGAFAESMMTRECSLYHKPKNISWDAAALTEPLSGAWKGRIAFQEASQEDFDSFIANNLRPYFFVTQAALPFLEKGDGKAIVNVSSTNPIIGLPLFTVYNSTKAGIVGFTRSLAREVGPLGIRANILTPGWIMTERQLKDYVTEADKRELMQVQSVKRLLTEQHVTPVTLFLLSKAAGGITGQIIVVDGGREFY